MFQAYVEYPRYVFIQTSNGEYLCNVRSTNVIQPKKMNSPNIYCQFEFAYADSSPFDGNITAITLKTVTQDGRYLAPHDGTTIKALPTEPHKYFVHMAVQ